MDIASLSEELITALGRLPGERDKAWKALIDYAQMEQRSLAGLARRYQSEPDSAPTKRLTSLKSWSSRFNWQARVAQWDLVTADQKVQEWARRKEYLNDLAWEQGMIVRSAVMAKFAAPLEPGELRLVVASWVDTDKVQRLAVNSPTDVVKMLPAAAVYSELEHEAKRLGFVRGPLYPGEMEDDPDANPNPAA